MRAIGFSTGALARSDFELALRLLRQISVDAIELSALRPAELLPLVLAAEMLDLGQFRYVAVHAPSTFSEADEPTIVEQLVQLSQRGWPIVVHPDAIHQDGHWLALGDSLLLENMDKRKHHGRTADEFAELFARFPKAGLCFDIAHARQFDPTMTEAYAILRRFGSRLRQVHISEVNTRSYHARISRAAAQDYQEVAFLIPPDAPVILESMVSPNEIVPELARARMSLTKEAPAHSAGPGITLPYWP